MNIGFIEVSQSIPLQIKKLYEAAFPLYERRPLPEQEILLATGKLRLLQLQKEDVYAGFIFYWQLSSCTFIEHFAIEPTSRGKGMGSNAMKAFAAIHEWVVLETEPAMKSAEAARRIRFYENLGYKAFPFTYLQPPYATGYPFQDMQLMHNGPNNAESRFKELQQEIYQEVYRYTPA